MDPVPPGTIADLCKADLTIPLALVGAIQGWQAGRRQLIGLIRVKAPRMAERMVGDLFTALDEQTLVVRGTDTAALIVLSPASQLNSVLDQQCR